MSKKSENNITTERILKGKHLDKDKQKTVPLINKQARLTDLCPEEKFKIGELIKTLEERRTENQRLKQEVSTLSMHFNDSQGELAQMTHLYEERERTIKAMSAKIGDLQCQLARLEETNRELSRKAKQYSHQLSQRQSKHSMGIQTERTALTDKSTGTVSTTVQVSAQTESQQRRDLFYRPHSKSFQKIMKGTLLRVDPLSTHPHCNHSPSLPASNPNRLRTSPYYSQSPEADEVNEKWNRLKFKHQQQAGQYKEEPSPLSFHSSSGKESPGRLEQIDEIMLNRMLRLRDFSASKLMKIKQSLSPEKGESPSVNYLKSPYFNALEPDSTFNPKTRPLPKQPRLDSQEQINFYESNLFEGSSENSNQ